MIKICKTINFIIMIIIKFIIMINKIMIIMMKMMITPGFDK